MATGQGRGWRLAVLNAVAAIQLWRSFFSKTNTWKLNQKQKEAAK